ISSGAFENCFAVFSSDCINDIHCPRYSWPACAVGEATAKFPYQGSRLTGAFESGFFPLVGFIGRLGNFEQPDRVCCISSRHNEVWLLGRKALANANRKFEHSSWNRGRQKSKKDVPLFLGFGSFSWASARPNRAHQSGNIPKVVRT